MDSNGHQPNGPISVIPLVPVMLDKQRYLKYTNLAHMLIEQALPSAWIYPNSERKALVAGEQPFTDLMVYLWAGLVHEDANLSLNDITSMPSLYARRHELWRAVATALGEAQPDTRDDGPEESASPLAQGNSVTDGSNTGPSPSTIVDSPLTNSLP